MTEDNKRFVVLHGELIGDALWDREIGDEWTLNLLAAFLNKLDGADINRILDDISFDDIYG